jgi:flagellar basal body P-ring protein FlgI
MKEKLAALKAIFGATTQSDVVAALDSIGQQPSGLLAQEIKEEGSNSCGGFF